MTEALNFLASWWGLIGFVIVLIIGLLFYRKQTLEWIKGLIFVAEEKARRGLLKTGAEKKQWVIDNGYPYLPAVVKPFISKEAFGLIVQFTFDQLIKWAEQHQLR
jgi:hypothetical protein